MKFSVLFPHLRGWVGNLANVWPAPFVKPNFAVFEVFHILTLIILGGASILIGLRLMNSGVTEERPSEVYADMRPWVHVGVWGVTISGILIGMANAERLYDSSAFLAKILCLVGGIALVYGATRPVALADGVMSRGAAIWTAVGAVLWLAAVYVFLTGGLIVPGLYHLATAGALIAAFVLRGRMRWIFVAGIAVMLVVMFLTTHVFIKADDYAHADPANVLLSWITGLWILGFLGGRMFTTSREGGPTIPVQALAVLTIVIWVTAAAGGRWIAFA